MINYSIFLNKKLYFSSLYTLFNLINKIYFFQKLIFINYLLIKFKNLSLNI